jgi:hypothetical protein
MRYDRPDPVASRSSGRVRAGHPGHIGYKLCGTRTWYGAGKTSHARGFGRAHRSRPHPPFDEPAARAYAGLPFKRARFDRLLTVHALSLGAVVVPNNEADFADVPGLVVENWTL